MSRRSSPFASTRVLSLLRRFPPRVPHTLGARWFAALGAGALILLGALPAAGQDPDPLSKLEPKNRFAIELLIDSAETAGVPSRPLLSKALEGIAKKADDRKIVAEVRRKFGFLKTARAALGPVNDEELNAAASVLEAGGKSDQLVPFRSRQKGRSDLEAFTVWADFLARGIPKDEASSAISSLWRDGADDATFHRLWNNVQTDILQGLNPGAALQNRIRESPGRPPSPTGKPTEGT